MRLFDNPQPTANQRPTETNRPTPFIPAVSRIAEVPLPLPEGAVTRKPRMNGKFVSLGITVNVRAPEIVMSVCAELQKDPRVKMSF
jgi:hypothetical protein